MSDPVRDLSESQKKCLRLAAQGWTSKEIAQVTGLSWRTVDTYLTDATATLGSAGRRQAARLFVEMERSEKLQSQSGGLVTATLDQERSYPSGEGGWRRWLRLPPVGGDVNDLTWSEKCLEALRVAAVGAATVLAISLAIAGLFQILR